MALVGQRAGRARDRDAGGFEAGRETVERGGVRHLPAEKGDTLAAVLGDDQSLLTVVHAQRQALGAAIDKLHAEKVFAEAGPVRERLRANADISEPLNRHRRLRHLQSIIGIWASLTTFANLSISA